jgi:hypothetical protein
MSDLLLVSIFYVSYVPARVYPMYLILLQVNITGLWLNEQNAARVVVTKT